jgi:hypothetical protein
VSRSRVKQEGEISVAEGQVLIALF